MSVMIKLIASRLKPAHGYSQLFHIGLNIGLPLLLLILVRLPGDFLPIAIGVVLLSKWRMFAVRPRFWLAVVRANAIDIIVGLSVVVFMSLAPSGYIQILWAVLYAVWLLIIKPATNTIMVALQAMIGQLCGLMALFLIWSDAPLAVLVVVAGLICYAAAHHFFDNFEEPYTRMLSYIWAYFAAALVWLLGHWLLFYGEISQPTLMLSMVGYGLAGLYYFDHSGRLSPALRMQFLLVVLAVVIIILAFSDWGDKVV